MKITKNNQKYLFYSTDDHHMTCSNGIPWFYYYRRITLFFLWYFDTDVFVITVEMPK